MKGPMTFTTFCQLSVIACDAKWMQKAASPHACLQLTILKDTSWIR